MSRFLLTGSTGCVGLAVQEMFDRAGIENRRLVRSRPRHSADIQADLADPATLSACCDGIDHVIHAAAWIPNMKAERHRQNADANYARTVNSEATIELARQALDAGVRSFVFISSTAAAGRPSSPMIDEETPCDPRSDYERSKRTAEIGLIEFANKTGLRTVILRPPMIAGEGLRGGPLLRLFKLCRQGVFPVLGDARHLTKPVIHVKDLARAAVSTARDERARGVYFVHSGQPHTLGAMIDVAARLTGRQRGGLPIPATPVRIGVRLSEAMLSPFGIKPPVTRDRLDLYLSDRRISIEKAVRQFGYTPMHTSLHEMLGDSFLGFRRSGQIR